MKTIIFLLLALGTCCPVFADTFTVTSNADSGPGTLREAITLANANGTAVDDIINFNIADVSVAGRSINLQSALPALSSRITIDGSTQPGAVIDISTAKVTLYVDHYMSAPFTFLYIKDASFVKIYGLRIITNPANPYANYYAIGFRNSTDITIGAPGKGNLITDVHNYVSNRYSTSDDSVTNLTIQSNVFGLNSAYSQYGATELDKAANVLFGGPNANEGNVYIGGYITFFECPNPQHAYYIKMQNNRFNLDWTGSKYYYWEDTDIHLWGATGNASTTRTWIQDNVFNSSHPNSGIVLLNIPHKVIITGNKIGTDINGTGCNTFPKLQFIGCKYVEVGGYLPGEENIIGAAIWSQDQGVNIIKNTMSSLDINGSSPGIAYVKITSYDNGLITGKALPNSKIQLYTVSTCSSDCLSKKYLTTTNADAAGNWSFPYTPAMPNIVATATTPLPDSSTSRFSTPKWEWSKMVIKHATCGKSNGSVTGVVVQEGTHITWFNSNTGQVVGHDTNLVNVPAGNYSMRVTNGANGCGFSIGANILDLKPPLTVNVSVQHATCGKTNGVLSIYSSGFEGYKWLNANYDSIGNNYFINQLPAGNYYLKIFMLSDTGCNKIYGPFTINNQSGPTLNMLPQITPATCSQANGSITGITAINITGTPYIQWTDGLNRAVSSSLDLLNVLPGKYRLKFKDQSSCDTIITPWYTMSDRGAITIDKSRYVIQASNCNAATGSITQLQVTNGDTYEWTNTSTNQVVGNSVDIYNLAAGSYQLKVTNATGCSQFITVAVPLATFKNISVTSSSLRNAFCNQSNGFVTVNSFSQDQSLYTFRWVSQSTGVTAGTGTSLTNVQEGSYQLIATDDKGCEQNIFLGVIGKTPLPEFDYSKTATKNDQCQLHQGAITGIQIGNLVSPTTYTWYDQNATLVGNTLDLQQVGAGTYTLKITDGGICPAESKPITLINQDVTLPPPAYDNITIPKNANAGLQIRNASAGTYRLYADAAGTILLDENITGNFTIDHLTADTSFYVQHLAGSCSSKPAPVKIIVVDRSFFSIPNAFTPNGDGHNDRLTLRITGRIDVAYFRVFNRWGQLVFETHRVNDSWDGFVNGQLQPSGTYVWIAQGKDLLGKVIQEKGSFVLIR